MNKENKVIKNAGFIFFTYLLFLLANNFKIIICTILNSDVSDPFNFINISILISTIMMSLIFIFRNYLFKKNKLNLWIIFCSLLIYNFAEGYILDFYSYPFIILYFYLLLITYFTILLTNYKFEISIVISFSMLILSAFFIGMFGLLIIFKYIMILSVFIILLFIYKIYRKDKNKLEIAKEKLFDSSFIIFNILWMIAIIGGSGLYVHSYDEYSHWAYDAKATIYYSKFGASQEIMSKTKAYAPIFTMWHYIVSIFNGFSEHNLYVGLNMLISIYLLPAFYWIKNNGIVTRILAFIAIVFCAYLFSGVYSYNSLYADYAIAVIFSSIIILYSISNEENINLTFPMILLLIITTLSKTNGFVISFVALLIIFLNELFKLKNISIKSIFEYIVSYVKKYWKFIIAIVITFVIWKLYLLIMSKITTEYYDFVLLPDSLKGDLKYKLNGEFVSKFIKKVFAAIDSKLIYGTVKINLFQFLLIIFTAMFIVFYIDDNKNIKNSLKKVSAYVISYIAFFAITVLSMFVAMSTYEASNLASFNRYLNWYHLGILIFLLYYVLKLGNNKNKLTFVPFIYLGIIILLPLSSILSFIINPIRGESYNIYLERNAKVKILNKNTPSDSMVYVIDQKDTDGIMAMWYTRYYAFPRKINASSASINWKIRTSKNKDDLQDWGLTASQWAEQLIEYNFDYVYLYSSDKEFFKETSFLYDDIEKAKKSSLFKVYTDGTNVKLIPIK
jgi:hypothetical protein